MRVTPSPSQITSGGGSVVVNADGSIVAGGGGGAAVAAVSITPPATSLSALDIHTHDSGLVAALRIWDDNNTPLASWNPRTAFGPSGNIATNAWITVNGNASQAYGPGNVTTDPYMLGICNDVPIGLLVAAGATAGNIAIAIANPAQSLAAAGAYTMMVTPDGTIHWGPGTSAGQLAAMDTALHRSGVGVLKTDATFQAGNIDSLGASQGIHLSTSGTWLGPAILSDSTERLLINPGGNPTTFGNNGGGLALLAVRGNGAAALLNIESSTSGTYFLYITSVGNVGVGTNAQFGAGSGVVGLANAGSTPSATPTGGGVLYASAGALMWKGSSGTTTTIAPA